MKKLFIFASVCCLAILSSCGGADNASKNKFETGNGVLAPIAEKYIDIAVLNEELDAAIDELRDSEEDDAINKMEKKSMEVRAKKDALETKIKTIAEELKGKTIPCTASEATGIKDPVCTINGINAGSSSARVVLYFTASNELSPAGCLYKNDKGEVLSKMKTFIQGDGSMGIIYTLSINKGPEGAVEASQITAVELVSDEEFEAATVITPEK